MTDEIKYTYCGKCPYCGNHAYKCFFEVLKCSHCSSLITYDSDKIIKSDFTCAHGSYHYMIYHDYENLTTTISYAFANKILLKLDYIVPCSPQNAGEFMERFVKLMVFS